MTRLGNRTLIFRALVFAYLTVLPIVVVGYGLLFELKDNPTALGVIDYGLRDFSLAAGFWLLGGFGVVFFLQRRIDRPGSQLANVMKRIADGDWAATIPPQEDAVLESISCSIQRAFGHFETREQLRIARLGEMRGLIRRVLDLVDAPVLVIGFHAKHTLKLDYANAATASAFGDSLESLEGASLCSVPGGKVLCDLVDRVLESGGAHFSSIVGNDELSSSSHVADCALVRNRLGIPTRLVVVLKTVEEEAWWRRLWVDTSGAKLNETS